VRTWEFATIEDAAAEILSKHEGSLNLSGLSELSDAAAESLSKHEGDLDLSGLTELSDEAAKSLAMHRGKLQLASLTSLSEVAANVLVELVHPVVNGTQIPAKIVRLPEFEKGLFNYENQARIARVNSIQTLLSDIDQLIYECGCDHRDETAAELQQALIKFAYRYEVAGNGGRITKEIANSLISCFEYMGGSEVLEEILQWNVEVDEEARSILDNYEEGLMLKVAAEKAIAEEAIAEKAAKCPECGSRLRTNLSKQCLECGADWHRRAGGHG
jgi:hypothetical protein